MEVKRRKTEAGIFWGLSNISKDREKAVVKSGVETDLAGAVTGLKRKPVYSKNSKKVTKRKKMKTAEDEKKAKKKADVIEEANKILIGKKTKEREDSISSSFR